MPPPHAPALALPKRSHLVVTIVPLTFVELPAPTRHASKAGDTRTGLALLGLVVLGAEEDISGTEGVYFQVQVT